MNKILEALKKLLPANQVQEVSKAIEDMLAEGKTELESEFNNKLKQAYDQISEELTMAEQTADAGYSQAYEIISDLQKRLESQNEEFQNSMDEGFEEAWNLLQAEKEKNKTLEVTIYEEFNGKIKQMRDLFVEKTDEYLHKHNAEMYETARRDLLSDPRMVEHKVALDKIIDILTNYVSEEDFAGASANKVEEANRAVDELRGRIQVLESRNVRLSTQNTKLNEQVREANNLLTENKNTERKERSKVAGNVSGRGQRVMEPGEKVIAEFTNPQLTKPSSDEGSILENNDALNDLLVLSGLSEG